jgi:hypothetical protein
LEVKTTLDMVKVQD